MVEETGTKIVIQHRGNQAIVGIQRNGCDPIFFMTEGDIQIAIDHVTEFIREAEINWQTNPLYPKAEILAPSLAQVSVEPHQALNTTANPVNKQQEAMF